MRKELPRDVFVFSLSLPLSLVVCLFADFRAAFSFLEDGVDDFAGA